MSVIYEDADGIVQTMQKRATAKMSYSGHYVGTEPTLGSVSSVSDIIGARNIFNSESSLVNHAKDFAKSLQSFKRISPECKEAVLRFAENTIREMPIHLKRYERLAVLNKYLQSKLNEYINSL